MRIRRIIVGLHAAPRDREVVEAAAKLAARLEVELVGLFVENIDLLHFAALPFAQELGTATATRRNVDASGMERSMRALAAEMERMLAMIAARIPVRWSFRVARGPVVPELFSLATEADLVVANIELPARAAGATPVRVVRAGDPEALRTALEEGDGVLVLAGASGELVGDTLRRLLPESAR